MLNQNFESTADREQNEPSKGEHQNDGWESFGPEAATHGTGSGDTDSEELLRLAKLSPLAYDRERLAAAERLGCRVGTLDEMVAKLRRPEQPELSGRPLDLSEAEPWPEPVNGEHVLDGIVAALNRHIVLDETKKDATALWIASVPFFEHFHLFPRLAVLSPEKRCGKTTLLDFIEQFVPRPLKAGNITASALFRSIEMARPTMLIDEADSFLPHNEELRGILNSGDRQGGSVVRNVGSDHTPCRFNTYAPAAIAAIGKLPGTIEDRSIIITLRRRLKSETVLRFRSDRVDVRIADLARKCARLAKDLGPAVAILDPKMPDELFNRTADNWRPLFAVADAIGGKWPERARKAAIALVGSAEAGDDQSIAVQLLADIRAIFDETNKPALFSQHIVEKLLRMEERVWPEYRQGKPLSKSQLAGLLKRFSVSPSTVRDGVETRKGYTRAALSDAFARYLPEVQSKETSGV